MSIKPFRCLNVECLKAVSVEAIAMVNIAKVTGAIMSREKYSPMQTRTRVQSRSNVRTSRSCFMGEAQVLSLSTDDVRTLGRHHCRAKQKPKTNNENSNLNKHCKEKSHQTEHVSSRDPACRSTSSRLDDGNSRLRRAQKIDQELCSFEKHHQHREYNANGACHNAGPNGALQTGAGGAVRRV